MRKRYVCFTIGVYRVYSLLVLLVIEAHIEIDPANKDPLYPPQTNQMLLKEARTN
jgi:hypothetical protein